MTARLIVNADDFGLTAGVNRAIGELASAGVITSATLMVNGPAFDDAVAVARSHPNVGVGCHIVLVDGTPVSPPETVPSLLGTDGRTFRTSLGDFLQALFLGRIHPDEIAREALAQIEKLQRAGIAVTHIDSHKHTHLFSAVARPLLDVADRASIRAIRHPFEPPWSLALNHGSGLRRLGIRAIGSLRPRFEANLQRHAGRIATTDGTVAISATGNLDSASLAQVLAAVPPNGTYELCCHPGYNDRDLDRVSTRLRAHRDIERAALLSEVPNLLRRPNAPRLIHYGNLDAT